MCRPPVVVPVYAGMTDADALELRFDDAARPPASEMVFIRTAVPPAGVSYNWFRRPGTAELREAYAACRAEMLGV